jgi:Domain of unknown function (DUF932)
MSKTLMQASHQWANRPSDERFTSLTEMLEAVVKMRRASASKVLSSRSVSVAPVEGDSRGLVALGPDGTPVHLSNWSFGQLAKLAASGRNLPTATNLTGLPSELAADCVNYGLQTRDVEDIGVLLTRYDGGVDLRAVTGPNYGRVWNADVIRALVNRFGDGVTGDFRVPGEFGKAVEVTKANTTLYASDRDMFVFLADEKNRIEMPGRRGGETGSLARGFFVWNSEVGKTSLGIGTFLFDYVCCNRIVWGAEQYAEVRINHTAKAPDRWIEEAVPAIHAYADSSAQTITHALEAARAARIWDVDKFLVSRRFTRTKAAAIKAAHMNDEGRPIETLWDAATAVTAYARGVAYQDERVELEREGGRIIDLAQ